MSESDITSEPPGSSDLVVVGASAGGVEALSILISTLSPAFPAPIVLAQHLDPNRPSALDAILQRRTPLPVVVVQSHTSLGSSKVLLSSAAQAYGDRLIAVILTGSGFDGAADAVDERPMAHLRMD